MTKKTIDKIVFIGYCLFIISIIVLISFYIK
jgi:hypothetical protein